MGERLTLAAFVAELRPLVKPSHMASISATIYLRPNEANDGHDQTQGYFSVMIQPAEELKEGETLAHKYFSADCLPRLLEEIKNWNSNIPDTSDQDLEEIFTSGPEGEIPF